MKSTSQSETVDLHHRIQLPTATRPVRTPINRSALRHGVFLIALAWLAALPMGQAITPPPDGGYPGGNTAEGQGALFSRTTGTYNTALGYLSLRALTDGGFCTGVGAGTLLLNTADENTATGAGALLSNTIGFANTANGAFALVSNTEGEFNTATGVEALKSNTTGDANTANGFRALVNNTTGSRNTANGVEALFSNQTGNDNTANGFNALVSNTTGSLNTANGTAALISNVTGSQNTATGVAALAGNTTGSDNTANGFTALASNAIGHDNTAIGFQALYGNTDGNFNAAIGMNALVNNTTGNSNTAIGLQALQNNTTGSNNTAIGRAALLSNTTGVGNVALGDGAGASVTTASNVIAIGATGADVTNSCFINNIRGVTTANSDAIPVLIDSNGQLGTTSSSRRFKSEIRPMEKASEAILALEPVTFHYKSDGTETPQFGLIAEDVAKVNPDLIVRDDKEQIYTVRYDAVNAMLLNEFLKDHQKVETQEATIADLTSTVVQQQERFESKIAEQDKQIEALKSGLQKVSARIEISSPWPASQMVLNER